MFMKTQQLNEESRGISMSGAENQTFENKAVKGEYPGAM